MKTLTTLIATLIVTVSTLADTETTTAFDIYKLEIADHNGSLSVNYPDCRPIAVGRQVSLPARAVLLPLGDPESVADIDATARLANRLETNVLPDDLQDEVTSDISRYAAVEMERNLGRRLGFSPVEVSGQLQIEDRRYAELLIFPVTVDDSGQLTFNSQIEITVGERIVVFNELLERNEVDRTPGRDRQWAAVSDGPEYVVITSSALAEAMMPLVVYKNETGYVTELALIEDILPGQSGRDNAEKLREYLKTFYAAGGTYVLLAGDETVLPIRHAYPNNTSVAPPLDALQICDLYFADLTGEWDSDNDGIWGEKYSDHPDIVPELLVGRLPINSSVEATNYVTKLIKYETDPGGDNRAYLERAFFFSSDQMRDYGDDGQHGLIASAYPEWFALDTTSAVEQSTGSDPAPSNLDPSALMPVLQEGYGIVNVIAHGRSDGFVLKSSGYNAWPKTYMLTGETYGGHGGFQTFADAERPAFYYSLACDNGGFDLDQPPISHTTPNMAQELIGSPGGAVGFIAYSRWGWISSSHILQKTFFDSLFAHPERPAVEALSASKAVLYYYTDLVYGLNFFGDPTLKVYARTPAQPELAARLGLHGLNIKVNIDGAPAECDLVLAQDGEIIGEFTTDQNGDYTIAYEFETDREYRISSVPEAGTIAQIDYVPTLATDVDDDIDPLLPTEFALSQNYPNPFNPSTTISFSLPETSPVQLTVFNVLGQTVATLVDETLLPGPHEVEWLALGDSGERVASGIYLYRIETDFGVDTKKMVLLK